MNTIDEMIEVLQAMKEGKAIECLNLEVDEDWFETAHTRPDFSSFEYRVKREPMVIWGVVYSDGSVYASKNKIYAEDRQRDSVLRGTKLIKFVEVIE